MLDDCYHITSHCFVEYHTMDNEVSIWRGTYMVHSYEIDPLNRIRFQAIGNYLQDAAGADARRLGVSIDQLLPRGMTWMLNRLCVQLNRLPGWGEIVHIETWPAAVQRLHAIRDFIIRDERKQEIGVATTAWLLIDLSRKRPMRLPDWIVKFHPIEPKRAIEWPATDLPPVEAIHLERAFDIRLRDLDLNRHVNNASYIEWMLETLPPEFYETRAVERARVVFANESHFGEQITGKVQIVTGAGTETRHVIQGGDGRELARAHFCWVESELLEAGK